MMTVLYLYVEDFTTNYSKAIMGKIKASTFQEFLEDPTRDWLVISNNERLNIVFKDDIEKIITYKKNQIIYMGEKVKLYPQKNTTTV